MVTFTCAMAASGTLPRQHVANGFHRLDQPARYFGVDLGEPRRTRLGRVERLGEPRTVGTDPVQFAFEVADGARAIETAIERLLEQLDGSLEASQSFVDA